VSPLWRDVLVVHVARTGVRLRRHVRGWKATPQHAAEATCDGSDPVSLGAALAALLTDAAAARTAVRIVLSNDLVRFAMLDGAHQLRGAGEQDVAIRHRLRSIHGPVADTWRWTLHEGSSEAPAMIAAADGWLLDALQKAVDVAALRLRRIEPWLAVAARAGGASGGTDLFVAAEASKVVIATMRGSDVVGLRSVRLHNELVDELPRILDQMHLIEGRDGRGKRVTLVSDATALPRFPEGLAWDIHVRAMDPTWLGRPGAHA